MSILTLGAKKDLPAAANRGMGILDRLEKTLQSDSSRLIQQLYEDELLVQTKRGFYMVVPNWNLDVAIGIVRDGVIEPWTNEVFLSTFSAGDTVVNVGANFGYYSLLAGHKTGASGKVYAVEANPYVYRYLLKGMFWSGLPNIVEPYLCAAVAPAMSGKPVRFSFDPQFIGGGNMFTRSEKATSFSDSHWHGTNMEKVVDNERKFVPKGILTEIETEGRMLDEITKDASEVKSLLIDAEGSESYVIAGAKKMITRSTRLEIVMEWDPATADLVEDRIPFIESMWDFLLDAEGFSPYRICHEGFAGIGHMPELARLDRESLYEIPHSDVYLRRE